MFLVVDYVWCGDWFSSKASSQKRIRSRHFRIPNCYHMEIFAIPFLLLVLTKSFLSWNLSPPSSPFLLLAVGLVVVVAKDLTMFTSLCPQNLLNSLTVCLDTNKTELQTNKSIKQSFQISPQQSEVTLESRSPSPLIRTCSYLHNYFPAFMCRRRKSINMEWRTRA